MDAQLEDITNQRRIGLFDSTYIGRSKACQIHLTGARVSRQHAMIRPQDGRYWFFDLGSANGSYINGRRVTVAQSLENGDQIDLSDHRFIFHRQGPPTDASQITEIGLGTIDATIADVQLSEMIMLVSDIRNFSKISEKLPPEELAQAIGGWYRECGDVIDRCGGTLDKFIGDSLFAYWPTTSTSSRRKAIIAAGRLGKVCERIQAFHAQTFTELDIEFEAGVGIHLGRVAHGAMSEGVFTLLGDAVNVAFRIEALTRDLQREVLVSEDFLNGWEAGQDICVSEGSHEIKGRSTPLVIYSVQGVPGDDPVTVI